MKPRSTTTCLLFAATLFLSFGATAQENAKPLAEKLKHGSVTIKSTVKGCDQDIKEHCPGLGKKSDKIFMCLSAYEDELTQQCKRGVLEATLAIQTGRAAIQYSIRSCEADADTFCLDVQPGQGRMLKCLKTNETSLSPKCVSALKETGLWNKAP